MIIKLFRNKGRSTATGAVNYVLSDYDSNRNKREVKPVVLKGDPFRTKAIDSLCPDKWTSLSTSGAIAFRDKEELTKEQKAQLIDQFERTFFGNMNGRVNILWVEHRDKGNLELHFVINKADLGGDKVRYFNAFPPGHIKKKDAFVKLKNDEFGFQQVEQQHPFKTRLSDDERRALLSSKHGFTTLERKATLDKTIKELVLSKQLKNRNDVIKWLKDNGFKLSRVTDSAISIEVEGGRNLRLKGGLYENSQQPYIQLMKDFRENKPVFNRQHFLNVLATEIDKSNRDNEARYLKTRQKPTEAKKGTRSTQSPTRSQKAAQQPAMKPDQAQQPQAQPKRSTPTDTAPTASSSSAESHQPTTGTDDSHSRTVSTAGIDGAVATVQRLTAQLVNAKTLRERIRLEYELAAATAKLEAEKQKHLEQLQQQGAAKNGRVRP